jgi:hypothetical protein
MQFNTAQLEEPSRFMRTANSPRPIYAAVLVLALAVAGAGWLAMERAASRGTVILKAMHALAQGPVRSSFRLADWTPFRWERVVVFGPYTAAEQIEAALGPGTSFPRGSAISRSDSVSLLVFLEGGRVVGWADVPRSELDWADVANPSGWTREAAIFAIQVGPDGWRRVGQQVESPATAD